MTRSARMTTLAMTVKCVFALCVLGLLAAVNYIVLKRQIEITRPVADVVNASGGQLLLLQRTILLAKELVHAESPSQRDELRAKLHQTIDDTEKTHHRLIRKDPQDTRPPPAKVKAIYEDSPWLLDTEVRNFVSQSRSLAKADDAELTPRNPHFRFISNIAASQRIFDGLNEVVAAYQNQSVEETVHLRDFAYWSLWSTLGVLALTGGFVFWPMVRRVRSDMNELTHLNDTLEERVAVRSAMAEDRARDLARSEAALKSQGRILQSILDSMGDGVIVADSQYRFLLFNPAAQQLLNIQPGDEPPDEWTQRWTENYGVELFHPDGTTPYPADELPLPRAIGGEAVDRDEVILRRADAQDTWLSVTARPLVDESGNLLGGVAVLRDATERKQSEQQLRDSEALYHSLVDNLPMCVLRKDLVGKFTFVNDRFCQAVGKPPGDILGKTDFDLYPQELAEKFARDDRRAIKTGKVIHHIDKNQEAEGRLSYVEVLKAPLLDSRRQVLGTQTIFWDVTQRKQAEQEVREKNRVLEHAVEGIAQVDPQGCFVTVNRAFAAMLGYKPKELRGWRWMKCVHLADQAVVSRADAQMRETGRAQVETRVLRQDGSTVFVELLLMPARDDSGGESGHYCFAKDITDRKEAERRSLQSERLAAVGQMVAAVAHESRNALQQIQACTSMLAWEFDGEGRKTGESKDAIKVKELIADVQQAQDRLHRLFEDLRGYTAPLSLKTRLQSLSDTLHQAWEDLTPLREGRRAVLHQQTSELNLACEHDAFQFEQVFRNLLENSLAACEDPARIEVVFSESELDEKPAFRIAVRDNGPGLSAEQRQKLFEAFYTTKTKGTGLGMPIAKRIVEAHGGRIETGQCGADGTEILITLPRGTP